MIVTVTVGTILAIFVLYQALLALVSFFAASRGAEAVVETPSTRFGVLIPAHNEESLVGDLVESIFHSDYPAKLIKVFVIADNCSDRTAEVATSKGATCLERLDESKRGKPYALDWALGQISLDDFDGFTIIDADTTVDTLYFRAMDAALQAGHQAIQGYFGVLNPDENWLTRLSVLPGTLRYKLQCPAKSLLGLSCPLAGNGMAFDADIFRRFGWNAYSVAENWEYYVILTLEDYVVHHESGAVIYSQVADSLKEGKAQRMRWLRGRVDTISRYWKVLLGASIRRRKIIYLDTLIELVRPSHSILFLMCWLFLAACLFGWIFLGLPVSQVYFSASLLAVLTTVFLSALVLERSPLSTWLSLGMVPVYLVWKLLVSIAGILTIRDRSWVKTKRN